MRSFTADSLHSLILDLNLALTLTCAILLLAPILTASAPIQPRGSLSGHSVITHNTYFDAPFNPPYCGMPYSSLDLSRITAVQGLDPADCGACIEVCGQAGCKNLLVVDKGGRGLDISTTAKDGVLGFGEDIGLAGWRRVGGEMCEGVRDGRMG